MMQGNDESKQCQGERRRQTRKNVVTHITYRVIAHSGGVGQTKNISERGLCFILQKELSVGTILEVKFELPGQGSVPVETFVKVIWCKRIEEGFLTGVKIGCQ